MNTGETKYREFLTILDKALPLFFETASDNCFSYYSFNSKTDNWGKSHIEDSSADYTDLEKKIIQGFKELCFKLEPVILELVQIPNLSDYPSEYGDKFYKQMATFEGYGFILEYKENDEYGDAFSLSIVVGDYSIKLYKTPVHPNEKASNHHKVLPKGYFFEVRDEGGIAYKVGWYQLGVNFDDIKPRELEHTNIIEYKRSLGEISKEKRKETLNTGHEYLFYSFSDMHEEWSRNKFMKHSFKKQYEDNSRNVNSANNPPSSLEQYGLTEDNFKTVTDTDNLSLAQKAHEMMQKAQNILDDIGMDSTSNMKKSVEEKLKQAQNFLGGLGKKREVEPEPKEKEHLVNVPPKSEVKPVQKEARELTPKEERKESIESLKEKHKAEIEFVEAFDIHKKDLFENLLKISKEYEEKNAKFLKEIEDSGTFTLRDKFEKSFFSKLTKEEEQFNETRDFKDKSHIITRICKMFEDFLNTLTPLILKLPKTWEGGCKKVFSTAPINEDDIIMGYGGIYCEIRYVIQENNQKNVFLTIKGGEFILSFTEQMIIPYFQSEPIYKFSYCIQSRYSYISDNPFVKKEGNYSTKHYDTYSIISMIARFCSIRKLGTTFLSKAYKKQIGIPLQRNEQYKNIYALIDAIENTQLSYSWKNYNTVHWRYSFFKVTPTNTKDLFNTDFEISINDKNGLKKDHSRLAPMTNSYTRKFLVSEVKGYQIEKSKEYTKTMNIEAIFEEDKESNPYISINNYESDIKQVENRKKLINALEELKKQVMFSGF